MEKEKQLEKERRKREAEEAQLKKEKILRTPASELFRSETNKYSKFDEKVIFALSTDFFLFTEIVCRVFRRMMPKEKN